MGLYRWPPAPPSVIVYPSNNQGGSGQNGQQIFTFMFEGISIPTIIRVDFAASSNANGTLTDSTGTYNLNTSHNVSLNTDTYQVTLKMTSCSVSSFLQVGIYNQDGSVYYGRTRYGNF
jgi:hypothetical protein